MAQKEFYNDLELKVDGVWVNKLPKKSGPDICSEELLYEAAEVKYKGYPLDSMRQHGQEWVVKDSLGGEEEGNGPKLASLRLCDIREGVLTQLQEEIEEYFPHDSIDSWAILDPKNMPTSPQDFEEYGENEITKIGSDLGYQDNLEELLEAWRQLMTIFSQQRFLCVPSMRTIRPGTFWTWVLNTYGPGFETELEMPILTRFIRHILVVPASSAVAER